MTDRQLQTRLDYFMVYGKITLPSLDSEDFIFLIPVHVHCRLEHNLDGTITFVLL
jgi:hypothetical protein